jgi:hypothetical protein
MEVRVPVQERTEGLDAGDGTGLPVTMRGGFLERLAQGEVTGAGQSRQAFPANREEVAKALGEGEDDLAVRNRSDDLLGNELGEEELTLLSARWADAPGLA